jgi:hypothetical protein
MSANGERRRWRAADNLRIVLAGMQGDVEVSDLCCDGDRHICARTAIGHRMYRFSEP